MKLRRMVVDSFRAIAHQEVSFADRLGRIRPVTVLAGPNGCGKTSVIFAIVQTLRYVMRYNTSDVPVPSDWDVRRSLGSATLRLSPAPRTATVSLDLEFRQAEMEAIATVFRDVGEDEQTVKRVLDLADSVREVRLEWQYPPGRFPDGTNKPPNFVRSCVPYEALEMFQGRSRAISGYRERILSDRALLHRIGGIYLFPQDRNLQDRVLGEGNGGLRERHPTETEDLSESERQGRGVEPRPIWGTLEYLGSYVRARRQNLPDSENWEKRIQGQFQAICGPKQYLGFFYEEDDPRGAPYIQDGETIYPLNVAASGEQVILEYVTRLNHPSPVNHSLVLIDEPEVHLHPGWIRQLYRVLPQIGLDNQYIVTTHSVELRAMAAEDGALVDMGELVSAAT